MLSVLIILVLSTLMGCAGGSSVTSTSGSVSASSGSVAVVVIPGTSTPAISTAPAPQTDKPVTEPTTDKPVTVPTTESVTAPVTEIPATQKSDLTVKEPDPPVTTPDKVIYLTFDDGPGPYTEKLLEVLDKYNVKATFFVVNKPNYNYLITKEYEAGHSIGVHAYKHTYSKVYASDEAFFEDFNDMNEVVKTYTGSYTNLLRFPGGSSNTVSKNYSKGIMSRLTKAVEAMGLHYFDWNVTSGDAGETTDTDEVYKNVIKGVKNRRASIVLQHDTKGFSVAAVERIILWGLENGYTFLPLNENSPGAHHGIAN